MKRAALPIALLLLMLLLCACSDDGASPDGDAPDGDQNAGDGDVDESPGPDGDTDTLADGDEDADLETDGEVETEPAGPFRIGVISDVHLTPVEDANANVNFKAVGRQLSAMDPPVEIVFSTGDNIEDMLCIPDVTCEDPIPVLTTFLDAIESFYSMPFYIVLGNHDNRYFDNFLDRDTPFASWQYVFGDTDHFPDKYYRVDHKGFTFLILNATSMAVDHDSNDEPTFSEEQLAWLAEQLDDGRPSVLFWHHYIIPPENDGETDIPLLQVIRQYRDTVKATFAGHEHHFERHQWQGVWFYQTENLGKNDKQPYHLIGCDPTDGSVTVVNAADIDYGD